MNDKIVPLARDQVVATFPGAGIELLTVSGSDIHERHPVIGFVVTRNATYPVTGTRGMGCRPAATSSSSTRAKLRSGSPSNTPCFTSAARSRRRTAACTSRSRST